MTTTPAPIDPDVPAWAVRLEAKVDVALTQHATRLDNHAADIADHETRIRAQEQRRTVSPQALWGAVVSAVTVASALFAMVAYLVDR